MKTKLIILSLIAIILGGVVYYSKNSDQYAANNSEWKIYVNKEYGYEIQYPAPATFRSVDSNRVDIRTFVKGLDMCPPDAFCPFSLLPGEYLLWIESEDCREWFHADQTERKVNGGVIYDGYEDQGGDNPGVRHSMCTYSDDGKYMGIIVVVHKDLDALAEEILSTFKFTK